MKIQNSMANSADPDKTAHDKPSHQYLYYLQNISIFVWRAEKCNVMHTVIK